MGHEIVLDTHAWFWLGARPDRLSAAAGAAIDNALKSGGLAILVVQLTEEFPRDPIDRIITATARAEGLPLVTRDAKLRRSRLVETVG